MRQGQARLLVALVLVAVSIACTHLAAEASSPMRVVGDVIIGAGEESGGSVAPPYQGEPDVGQTSGDPGEVEPYPEVVRLTGARIAGLVSWTSTFWVARLLGIGL